MSALLETLGNGIVLADGDPSTVLTAPDSLPLEALCIRDPDAVEAAHSAFTTAGSRIIRTLSRSANRPALDRFGLADHTGEILWQSAQIARVAARPHKAWVAGTVGPLAVGTESPKDVLRMQIGALLDGGCDLICLEGFRNPVELVLALVTKLELHHCATLCILDPSFPADAIPRLANEGAEIIACHTPDPAIIEQIRRSGPATGLFPSAPSFPPPSDPLSVDILGGAAGVSPAHIAAWHDSLAGKPTDS